MENITIKNAQGEQINIDVIRYFKLNGLEYLVFSLNEVDEGGYVKLYIAKVTNNIANTITDDVEWNLIKDTIKTVIKSNKDNLPLHIVDLDTNKLAQVQLLDQKVFKISDSFLQLLGANKNVETQVVDSINNVFETELQENQDNSIETSNLNNLSEMENITSSVDAPANGIVSTESVVDTSMVNNDVLPSLQGLNHEELSQFTNSTDINSETNNDNLVENTDYALDYKTLYENELNKNQMLVEENKKYKNMIDSLKNIINETF